jgi:hypothetical protein
VGLHLFIRRWHKLTLSPFVENSGNLVAGGGALSGPYLTSNTDSLYGASVGDCQHFVGCVPRMAYG